MSITKKFPQMIEVSELEAIAAKKDTYREEVLIEDELETKYRVAHSKAYQVLNNKLQQVRDLNKAIKSGFDFEAPSENGIDRTNRMLSMMVNETAMVDANYFEMTGEAIEETLPASNRMLFNAAINNYVPEMDVKELKKVAKKLEQELNEGFFINEHQNAFLVVAQSEGLQAWYTAQGVLIQVMEIEAANIGKVFSDSGASLLQAA